MGKYSKVAVAVAAILGAAMRVSQAEAQQAASSAGNADDLQEVVVTGLRASLQESMDIKRDAIGIVDAISAEDIGKFPDTNLSEALQRVTGISISRRNGEGALVTARGFGSEYNMVTLNGRMMPAADAFGGGGNGFDGGVNGQTRSFNFANLAAESISGIEVYKTSKANIADRRHRRHGEHPHRPALRQRRRGGELRRQRRLRHDQSRRRRHHAGSLGHLQLRERRQDVGRLAHRQLSEAR